MITMTPAQTISKTDRQWRFYKMRIHIMDSKEPSHIEYVKSLYTVPQLANMYTAIRKELRAANANYEDRNPITPRRIIDTMVDRNYIRLMDDFIAEECVIRN